MSKFKIYDELKEKSTMQNKLLSSEHRATLNGLSDEHREIIYAMILHHYIVCGNEIDDRSIPYKGKMGQSGKGVTFDTTNLPANLQKIIALYLESIYV